MVKRLGGIFMRTKNVALLVIIAIIIVSIGVFAGTKLISSLNQTNNTTNNSDLNDSINSVNATNTNNTNTSTVTTTKKSSSSSSNKKSSSSSDSSPSSGTYKGVQYETHSGGYPYYSPQSGKTYNNKEEINDLKKAIDSGIAD